MPFLVSGVLVSEFLCLVSVYKRDESNKCFPTLNTFMGGIRESPRYQLITRISFSF